MGVSFCNVRREARVMSESKFIAQSELLQLCMQTADNKIEINKLRMDIGSLRLPFAMKCVSQECLLILCFMGRRIIRHS